MAGLANFEEHLGIRFPVKLRELIQKGNGLEVTECKFILDKKEYCIDQIFSLEETGDNNGIVTLYNWWVVGDSVIDRFHVPFASSNGSSSVFAFSIDPEEYSAIYHYNFECEPSEVESKRIFNNEDDFLRATGIADAEMRSSPFL